MSHDNSSPPATPPDAVGHHPVVFDSATEGAYAQRDSLRESEIVDDELGLRAALVIDTEIGGRSCGGLRLLPEIRIGELQDLARTMTLKQVYVGSARGGARAAIVCPPDATAERQQQLINRFGERIRSELEGRKFLCARDLGTTATQLQAMYEHVGMGQQVKPKSGFRSGFFTAVSVLASIQAALNWENASLQDTRVTVEGFGKVGQALCQMLTERGARVVAVSDLGGCVVDERGLSMQRLLDLWDEDARAWQRGGGLSQDASSIAAVPSDIFAPCADHYTVSSVNARDISARYIIAGANNAVTDQAEQLLFRKGTIYLPDFITNSGGVLGNMLEYAGLKERELWRLAATQLSSDLDRLHRDSELRGTPPRAIAIEKLQAKLQRMKAASAKPGKGNSYLASLATSALNSPLFPSRVLGPLLRKRIFGGVGLD